MTTAGCCCAIRNCPKCCCRPIGRGRKPACCARIFIGACCPAPSVTSIYSLIGDQALFQVITTAYSLPTSMSNMDVDKQATMLKKFVDINDFQDPKKVDKLMNRFTAMYDLKNNTTTSSVRCWKRSRRSDRCTRCRA